MKPASCKAKGRAFQTTIAITIRALLGIPEPDLRPAIMGENGCDLKLSSAARAVFPFGVEIKKRETINIWSALKQAEENAAAEGLRPLLIFSRNRSKTYACLPLADFLEMVEAMNQDPGGES